MRSCRRVSLFCRVVGVPSGVWLDIETVGCAGLGKSLLNGKLKFPCVLVILFDLVRDRCLGINGFPGQSCISVPCSDALCEARVAESIARYGRRVR